jgi:hypothetical protein
MPGAGNGTEGLEPRLRAVRILLFMTEGPRRASPGDGVGPETGRQAP